MRPVILLGAGYRHMDKSKYADILNKYPVLTTWAAIDAVPENHPTFCGRPGTMGQRAANFIMSYATHYYVLGARMDPETVGKDFTVNEKYLYLDECDPAEMAKFEHQAYQEVDCDSDWLNWCKWLYVKFRPYMDGAEWSNGYVHPLWLVNWLSKECTPEDVLACGSSSTAPNAFLRGFKVKEGQRVTVLPTIGAMGADVPMAIGACIASGKRRTICVTGDGSFAMNMQALITVKQLDLPIIFFVLSNGGYASIRNMQNARMEGRHMGCTIPSGLALPDLYMVAETFGLKYQEWDSLKMSERMPFNQGIIEVMSDPDFKQVPVVGTTIKNGVFTRDAFWDMTPKLEQIDIDLIMGVLNG